MEARVNPFAEKKAAESRREEEGEDKPGKRGRGISNLLRSGVIGT